MLLSTQKKKEREKNPDSYLSHAVLRGITTLWLTGTKNFNAKLRAPLKNSELRQEADANTVIWEKYSL